MHGLYLWPVEDERGDQGVVIACSRRCADDAAHANGGRVTGDWIAESSSPLDYCEGCDE